MISSLTLENFRKFTQESFVFSEGITVIEGNNGVGKTNILEAIYALATGKPFRSHKKEVFVQHDAPYARVSGICTSPPDKGGLGGGGEKDAINRVSTIFWQISPTAKTAYFWDDIALSAGEYLKKKTFFAVLFSPEEMNLPLFAPKYRRNFLNRLLSLLFPEYFEAASKYEITLQNRNQLLKRAQESFVSPQEFFFWDQELIKWEAVIRKKREDFFVFVNVHISSAYQRMSGAFDDIAIHFQPSVDSHIPFTEALLSHFARDKMMGSTGVGPHRDDFQILLRGLPLEEDASRGETRSALLALKEIERIFIAEHTGTPPILLLDDVFSELDQNHREHLLKSLEGTQTILSTTECAFPPELKNKCRILQL
ncbi:MAG: DNA replication and repair protein RecF [Candidatus Peregrinibacteria bacterium]